MILIDLRWNMSCSFRLNRSYRSFGLDILRITDCSLVILLPTNACWTSKSFFSANTWKNVLDKVTYWHCVYYAFIWLKYCQYGVKHYPINQSINIMHLCQVLSSEYNAKHQSYTHCISRRWKIQSRFSQERMTF